ncbi:MAG: DUF445 domain-containing protein [Calditrichia bacterium]
MWATLSEFAIQAWNHPDFWKYVSIPIVASLVGWITNWVAVKLLFHPLEPIGKPPFFGWQGIIPSKAAKMGAMTADSTLSKLGSLPELFRHMEPERIADHLINSIQPRVEEYVDAVMMHENPAVWELIPGVMKTYVYTMVKNELPLAMSEMMADLEHNINDVVDLKQTVVDALVKDKRIINSIFMECGKKEFEFIVRSGLCFGLFFGIIQMIVWSFYQAWWILPLFGMINGYATNWIAIRIIFQPLNPVKIGPLKIQGLFLKRQKEVAAEWCSIVAGQVITVRNIINDMLNGAKSERTHIIVRRHIRDVVDRAVGITKPIVQFTVGLKEFVKIKESASETAIHITSEVFDDPSFNEERAAIIKELLEERMIALSSEEFQYLLRPAFEEEELKLIIVGAILGALAGFAQLVYIFGGSL